MFLKQPEITGKLELGDGNIVSTNVKFINEHPQGEIIVGKGNLFEDCVVIINTSQRMVIGDKNQFHSGCMVSASSIGNHNEIGAFAKVDQDVVIGNHCNVGVKVHVKESAVLVDQTNQFSNTRSRISPTKPSIHVKHLEYLYENLPKYHSV